MIAGKLGSYFEEEAAETVPPVSMHHGVVKLCAWLSFREYHESGSCSLCRKWFEKLYLLTNVELRTCSIGLTEINIL